MSRAKQIESLMEALFRLYVEEHGGEINQPYLVMCWVSGRVDDLINHFNDKRQDIINKREVEGC